MIPAWHKQVMLLLRAERLSGAAREAIEGGDEATASRLVAEAMEAFAEARELAEKARNQ